MDWQSHGRLRLQAKAVKARRVMVAHMACANVFVVRAGDWRGRRRDRRIGGHMRYLRLRGGVGLEVVRGRRPPLPDASGIHARDECHDVRHAGRHGNEVVRVASKGDMERGLRDGRGEVLRLVQDVVVSTAVR